MCIRDRAPEERETMGKKGREYVLAHHTYPVLARRFARELERIVKHET